MKKRLFSIFLSLALVLSMMPLGLMAVQAESYTATTGTGAETDPYVVHNWAALKEKMSAGGYIQLGEDVIDQTKTVESYLSVPSGVTVNLDLNGHTIDRGLTTAIQNGYVLTVSGTLNITDSSQGNTGKITGGNNSDSGGGVYVGSGGTLDLMGGTISDNKVAGNYCGGGVYVGSGGTFTISGNATISGNSVTGSNDGYDNGGGVYVGGTFNMTGGTIANNTTTGAGGGVMIVGAFNMSGGSITGNKASRGGGVWLNYGSMTLNGGSITGNTAESQGGGITITHQTTFNLSGNPIVTGNTVTGGKPQNLWLGLASGSSYYSDPMITVTGELSNTTPIGVSMDSSRTNKTITSGFAANNPNADPATFFTSDDSAYLVESSGSEAMLSTAPAYDLWVAGTQVTSANAANVLGDSGTPTVVYTPSTNTLTLNGATINGGSDNTNYYGYGICYKGTEDLNIVASGTNIVCDNNYRNYASYGIVIGDPSPRVAYTTGAERDITITVSEGASLAVSGGNVNGNENFCGTWGICNKTGGSLTIDGGGALTAAAPNNVKRSCGIFAGDVTIGGSCSVTATGDNSEDGISAGIYCGNLNVPQSFTGTITAQSGSAPATLGYGTNGTFGILARGNNSSNGNISIAGGTVTASSGVRTGGSNSSSEYATGIYADYTISITDGATVNATGDGHGIFCYNRTISINSSSVTAIGGNYAVNGLELTGVTAEASTEKEGSSLVPYDSSAINTYKYVKTTPESAPPVPTCDASIYIFDATENENDQGGRVIFENQEYGSNFTITKPAGTSVTVTAAPDEGYTFSAWRSGGTEGDFLSDSTEYTFTIEDTPGGIWAVFEKKPPAPPSGSGGGEPSYKVEVPDDVENGSVSVSPKSAKEGDTVTITATPDEGFEVDGIKVTDKDGKEIEVKDNGDGTYSFVMPGSKVNVEAVIIPDEDVPLVNRPFVDVPEDSWFYDAVYYCYDNGSIKGVDETHFAPNDTTTRAMIVTILWRMEGAPSQSASQTALPVGASQDKLRFEDVEKGSWYEEAVNWAAEKEIVKGMSETTFAPNAKITREQMATILARYAEFKGKKGDDYAVDLSGFTDLDSVSDWALDAMNWSVATELMKGVTETTLDPKGNATRAQVAVLMQRLCENIL